MKGSIVILFLGLILGMGPTLSFGSEWTNTDNGYVIELSQDGPVAVTLNAESGSVNHGDVFRVAYAIRFFGNDDADLVYTDLAFWLDEYFIGSHKPNDLFLVRTYNNSAFEFT